MQVPVRPTFISRVLIDTQTKGNYWTIETPPLDAFELYDT
jgi:hypothetical protein